MTRRDLFKCLPALPLLPGLLSKLGAPPTVVHRGYRLPMFRDPPGLGNWYAGFGEPLAGGGTLHTRWTFDRVTRALIEKVQWVTKRGEGTVDGSTHYFR